ncbi:MAG: 1,4-dihydroxy-2-naphthoate octaprenyltransferase [Planctomycetota bacterium]|jgi:1,4-dihydroxy-2-naphthoate octaprenyltransferase
MNPVALWIKAMRAPFFQASLVPVAVGTAVAYFEAGRIDWLLAVLAGLGTAAINGGTNLMNDYYDHKSGNDEAILHPTPFSGGSRMIQDGLLTARAVWIGGMISYLIASVIGAYLIFRCGPVILALGAIGAFLSFAYTAPPLKIGYRGAGELITGTLLGPLAVEGGYFVQTGIFSEIALWASLPVGLLVASILFVNQFPDFEGDRAAGKRHLVVRLGTAVASRFFVVLLTAVYITIALPSVVGPAPLWGLLGLVSIPLALFIAVKVLRLHNRPTQLTGAQAGTIALHLCTGICLCISYTVG